LRVSRDELENEKVRNDVLQKENERLRTMRKKNLLNNTDTNDVNLIGSQTSSPLPQQDNNSGNNHTPEMNVTENLFTSKWTYNFT
ncbi:unnamed protein product, partial [Didymodactylos carnosus]